MKKVLVLGPTGLVGSELVKVLIEKKHDFELEITLYQRRSPKNLDPSVKVVLGDLAQFESKLAASDFDTIFCCLGTTIKAAKSKEAFQEVDAGAPVAIARWFKNKGTQHFLLISALGADPNSKIFYNSVKGECEEALKQIGFSYLSILRPSLLVGNRKEFRLGERISIFLLSKVKFPSFLRRYQPVEAKKVAAKLLEMALNPVQRVNLIESEQI